MVAGPRISHYEVFRRPGAFAGWPANYGLSAWDDEMLSVFAVGQMGPKGEIHEVSREHAVKPWQARSVDGGLTWNAEPFRGQVPGDDSLSADEHLEIEMTVRPRLDPCRDLALLNEPIDFLDPETIVMCARTGLASNSVSWFYVSRSRGRQWSGPFAFTGLRMSLSARTDILPLGEREALFMLTTIKKDGQEGRTFCARTSDGGRTFQRRGFVGADPAGYRIMPSSVVLPDGSLFSAIRCADSDDNGSIETFTSTDHGRRWIEGGRIVARTGRGGNPPALARLPDGRLALAYGCREKPFGLRLRLSSDNGQSWGEELVLRADGGTPDIGYPRAVVVGGGDLVVLYYFNDGEGMERYIAASRVHFPGT